MHINLIGVPVDFGAGRRGVDMGPSAIRYAGLRTGLEALGHEVTDLGNLEVAITETAEAGDPRLKYLEQVVDLNARLADAVEASMRKGQVPLVLGGDHSLALGSVTGATRVRRAGLIWLDTHGDFNTDETTPSGNIHGMPLAALCGYGSDQLITLGGRDERHPKIAPQNVAIVGLREVDEGERELLRLSGVAVYSMEMIDRWGIADVMNRALDVAMRGTDGLYLSLDLDVVDPRYAPGVGTPVTGGLTFREAHLAVELIAETERLVGMDLVEVNPILDERNRTGELAVQLALSALGKRVWRER